MDGLPCHKEYNLTYCPQINNTDCGLTCVSMLLEPSSKQFLIDNLDEIRTAAGFGHSTWTIDLCYVLRRFNVKFVYFTKTIGVDESRISDPNYEKSCAKDKSRVKRRFMEAESNGISIDKRTVEISALVRHLANDGPLILLINDSTLECGICRKKKVKDNVKYENTVFFASMPSAIICIFIFISGSRDILCWCVDMICFKNMSFITILMLRATVSISLVRFICMCMCVVIVMLH